MHINRDLFLHIKGVKWKFYAIIFWGLVTAALIIGQAFVLSRIINNVFLLHQTFHQVLSLLIIFIFFVLFRAAANWLQNYYAARVVFYVKKTIRTKLIEKIFKIGPILLKSERTGEITNTLIKGVDKLEDYFAKFLPQIFLAFLIPVIILLFVFPLDLLSGIIFLLTLPIIPLFMFLIGSIAEKLNQKQWKTLSRISAYFLDVLQGLQTLKLFNRTKETIKKIEYVTNIFRIKTLKILRVAFLSALVLEVAASISVALIAVAIGLRLLNGDFNFADALFILIVAPDFYLPLRQLGVSYHAGMEGVAAFERISEIIQLKEYSNCEIVESSAVIFDCNSQIKFENVSFSYEERKQKALNSISVTIEPQKFTALIGRSGSGKTTLINILLRFLIPQQGQVKIGTQNLFEIPSTHWRKNITWMPQNPYLFNATILDNIKLSMPTAKLEEVIDSAEKAKIHKLISALPKGYNTNINEAAENFSGGEIQRIALARAYLRKAPIVLIDEPTANLDPIVEEEIIDDMYKIFQGRTVIMIAHRLNTIVRADKILVLSHGKLIAEGNHMELMASSKYYKNLFN
ncbi:thiol reductant ABC exporter subunit CydD [Melioribacteraceae bacterium 4301-Me]|uniref:thiol reductant ABC exporter subunit CydD n=1 Tax=Pyranulibacter aquaticus TaxID=3163344 RepID=UPI00359B79B4